MVVTEHYRGLQKNSEYVLGSMLADPDAVGALTASHNYLVDFGLMKLAIANRPEVSVFDAAAREYQLALFALSIGQYRHAFVGLRLFFELMLATVQFSAHEIDYRLWEKDGKDINWSSLKSSETGVFSIGFINAFNPGFSDNSKQYIAIAEAVYRECSQFVHGNAGTHQSLPAEISFNKEIFINWHEKAKTMRFLIIFAFSARYLNHIESDAMNTIESVVLDAIGHLPAVQIIYSAVT